MTFREKLPDLLADPEVRAGYDAKRAERELPDFTTAPAWLNRYRSAWTATEAHDEARCDPEFMRSRAPWTPLDTPEGHVQRINQQRLATVIELAILGRQMSAPQTAMLAAEAVIAALPELMDGEA